MTLQHSIGLSRACFALLAILLPQVALSDGTLVSWGGDRIAGMSQERWDQAKKLTLAQVLAKNLRAKNFGHLKPDSMAVDRKQLYTR